MGCGSSQAPKVMNEINGKETVTVETVEETIDAASKDVLETIENGVDKVTKAVKYPPPEAFEIPVVVPEESLIKKHPPKRIQKLLEDRPQTPSTIEDLEDKLAKAEIRRQEIITQRVENTIKLREKDFEDNPFERKLSGGDTQSDKETVILTPDNEKNNDDDDDGDDAIKLENDKNARHSNAQHDTILMK